MSGPIQRRAEQLREQVLAELADKPHPLGTLGPKVARRVLAPVTQSQLKGALASLRKAGRIVYRHPCWELAQRTSRPLMPFSTEAP